jgi:hypothetical protein
VANIAQIIDAIGDKLKLITIANGYSFDIGSVSPPDTCFLDEFKAFPSVDMTWTDDSPDDEEKNAMFGFSKANIVLKLRTSLIAGNDGDLVNGQLDADTSLTGFMSTIREEIIKSNCVWVDTCNVVLKYAGTTKVLSANGDIFRPASLLMNLAAYYQMTKTV